MSGLFSSETEMILAVWDVPHSKTEYIMLYDILSVNKRTIFGAYLPIGSNPNLGIIKDPGPGHPIDLMDGYLLSGVYITAAPYHRSVPLTGCADSEAWKKIVEFFYRAKNAAGCKVEEEEGVIIVGTQRAFNPEIASLLKKIGTSMAAVCIFPGNDIDKTLNSVYLSKRNKPQEEG